ncbi:MAG: cupin domain-containing protein [bacterium]|jgi:quercetin dioxygenase-like cupin family protein|nr:cupin domain-containing protein [bacterium]
MAVASEPTLNPNRLSVSVEEVKARRGRAPWSERIVANDRYIVTVICQEPGHQNDWHYHVVDECWYIYEGELSWTMEGRSEPVHVSAGDWVLAPAGTFHFIQVHGDSPAIRIAIAYTGEPHRHERADKPPAPPGARVS